MKRVDDTYREVNKFGTGKDGYTEGDPGLTNRTLVRATMMDHLQEEIARTVEAGGGTPDGTAYHQLMGQLQLADMQRAAVAPLWTTPGTANLNAIAGGDGAASLNNRAVAVGSAGAIYRLNSTDVFVSDTPGSSFAGAFRDVIYAGATFGHVAVGAAEEIQTGAGGTWTRRVGALTDQLESVAWDPVGDVVVAVGANATIYESTAIATWNDRTASSALAGNLERVVWAPSLSLFVCCGAGGIQTSPDGQTWTQRSALDVTDVIWIESIGYGVAKVNGSTLYQSTNGLAWTNTTFDPGFGWYRDMHGCAGGILVVRGGQPTRVLAFASGVPDSAITVNYGCSQDGELYEHMTYDAFARGWWICGNGGAIGFAPALWGS